jgi:putative ABC transport system permease protein
MDRLTQDLRYAVRRLLLSRAFTATAVGTLALVIGANTAIFSVVSGVLMRPLPYREPDRLVRIWEANPGMNVPSFSTSRPNFEDWRRQARSFEELAAFRRGRANLVGAGEPETVETVAVSDGFFHLLGVSPAAGRSFAPGDDRPEAPRVALVTDAFTRGRFGVASAALGRSLILDGQAHEVVGVLPSGFRFGRFGPVDVWMPLTPQPEETNRRHHLLGVIGRLAAGSTRQTATAELATIAGRLAEQYPDSNRGWTVRVVSFEEWVVDDSVRQGLWVLLGAVGFVLLIACANLAALQLARATARHREMAVRAALGAGRGRLLAQLLTESLLLSLAGGAVGLALAVWGVDVLRAFIPPAIPRVDEIGLDRSVLAFNLVVSVLTGLLFGILPALAASRLTGESLREDSRTVTAGTGRRGFRRLLVGVEVALSIVLLVGAGLLARSFLHLQRVPLGFDPADVLSAQLSPARSRYPDAARRRALYEDVLGRAQALPGVTSAALTNIAPFGGGNSGIDVTAADPPTALAPGQALAVDWRAVSPDYFQTMRIPLLAGRTFAGTDTPEGPCVVVVSQRLAQSLWPDQDAVGRRLKTGGATGGFCAVLGVAGNVRNLELGEEPRAALYLALSQFPQGTMSLLVRSPLDRGALLAALRRELAAVDPELPLASIRSLDELVAGPAAEPRFNALLLGALACGALLLAAIGLYGLLSYWVSERTRELGVRMAVGARGGDVVALVMGQGLRVALTGVVAGALGAWAASRLLTGLLFGVSRGDPATYVVVSAVVAGTAALACYLPARRAARLDPLAALRYE